MPTKKTPTEVVLAWNSHYANRDVEGALKYMSDDFVRYGDTTNWAPVNRDKWADAQRGFMAGWPDWTWDVTNIVENGDTVVCEFFEYGTWTKPYVTMVPGLSFEPTGEYYDDHDCIWFRVNEDSLICEIRAYITTNVEKVYGIMGKIAEYKKANAK